MIKDKYNINNEPINKINIINYLLNELLQTDIIEKKITF
jgi:hypothetical protein